MNTRLPQLQKSELLSAAPNRLITLLEQLARPVKLARGETLFEQGDEGDALFVLEKGLLEVSILSAAGRKLTLNMLHSGDVFGEIALFDPGPRTATVSANQPSRLIRIGRKDLFLALERAPLQALDMIELAGKRLRWVSTQLEEHVFLPMGARLAVRLLHLAETGADPSGRIAMSQSAVADHVGVSREAVSKTLSEWKRLGWIELSRGGVRILDTDALIDISQPEFI